MNNGSFGFPKKSKNTTISKVDTINDLLSKKSSFGDMYYVNDYSDKIFICITPPGNIEEHWNSIPITQITSKYRYIRLYITNLTGTFNFWNIRYISSDGTNYPDVAMTSQSTPSPYFCTYSQYYGGGYEGWRSFDGNLTTRWSSAGGAAPQWIKLDLGVSRRIKGVGLTQNPTWGSVIGWEIQGSNTGSFSGEEVILYTGSQNDWVDGVEQIFTW